MQKIPLPQLLSILLSTALIQAPSSYAADRWDLMSWCAESTAADAGRCEGMLAAALDLTTHADFNHPSLCFPPDTRLHEVKDSVLSWLKDHPAVKEQSALALARRALTEQYRCRPEDR